MAFPHGKHADQVDAFTQAADWIEENRSLANQPRQATSPGYMATALHSQRSGFDNRTFAQGKPSDSGNYQGRGNSDCAE